MRFNARGEAVLKRSELELIRYLIGKTPSSWGISEEPYAVLDDFLNSDGKLATAKFETTTEDIDASYLVGREEFPNLNGLSLRDNPPKKEEEKEREYVRGEDEV
ncbi:MAG: hypothetical protein ACXABY_29875 [Candidatus Thorarchaeota archaeon]|jgi:hypothetical protein